LEPEIRGFAHVRTCTAFWVSSVSTVICDAGACSVRAIAQQQPNNCCGSRVKQKGKITPKPFQEVKRQDPKGEFRYRVNGLARVHSPTARPQGDKQMAAPAEPRTPNLHQAKRSLLESADGSMARAPSGRAEKAV